MFPRERLFLFFPAVAGALCLAATSARAGETAPSVAARAKADKVCSSYGPGFVSAGAPGQCVNVEERLRVERNARRAMSPWDAPAAFAPLGAGDGAMPAHLRVNGGFGLAQAPRHR